MATLSHPPRPTDPQSASTPSRSDSLDQDQRSASASASDSASASAASRPSPTDRPRLLQDTVTAAASAAAATAGATTAAPPAHPHSHRHTVSVSRLNQRSSTSIFALAAAALDRTQNAIATIAEPSIRHRSSNSTLSRLSLLPSPSPEPSSPDRKHRLKSASNQSLLSSANLDSAHSSQPPSANHPLSQPYATADPNQPPPIKSSPVTANKMHQTSSRLLRMTDDDRPFTRVCTTVLQYLPCLAVSGAPVSLRPSARGHETPPSETLLPNPFSPEP
ncbi:hypothetical protein BGZ61DRAFT_90854 [Ilyonectria robusta]|uniref:uncharacterized protein n=1 Tax=Ilyonectria robusta TaxID=1079257 RepID=UPI001E8EB1BA|nr:uncharacterized protein BGZ61DRAFT_90854 [Ilyonectria robusta]KAH8736043.1 hypothetical protein BGZ61DRAFT_90854 [Ilyonectria robusta]